MMSDIIDVFDIDTDEECICEDCGETKRLQFGICIICGGNVIDKENYLKFKNQPHK